MSEVYILDFKDFVRKENVKCPNHFQWLHKKRTIFWVYWVLKCITKIIITCYFTSFNIALHKFKNYIHGSHCFYWTALLQIIQNRGRKNNVTRKLQFRLWENTSDFSNRLNVTTNILMCVWKWGLHFVKSFHFLDVYWSLKNTQQKILWKQKRLVRIRSATCWYLFI